ncbi:MAG: hypothetical protein JOY91_04180 [Sinobacteraceae bacterium]|nr:hypothetical protein [Nevskiaceae bacterium]
MAAVFVALAVAGTVRHYSPVPYWDMWDGYLGFFVPASDGDLGAWWALHNEHRIYLGRLLFWIDLAWFKGLALFLLIVVYICVALTWWLFERMRRELAPRALSAFLPFFLAAWLFSWRQWENLEWGFQSAFLLSQLLPLAAFYLMHRATLPQSHSWLPFAGAVLCGLLAPGGTAAGLAALPLMTVYAILVRMRWWRVALLAILTLSFTWLYFRGYQTPPEHSSVTDSARHHPLGMIAFFLLYMGGPFRAFGNHDSSHLLVALVGGMVLCAGIFWTASAARFAWRIVPDARRSTLRMALLAFLAYVAVGAVGTAGGRLILGLSAAVSSRYSTPVLSGWAALILLYLPALESLDRRMHGRLWMAFLVLLVALLPQQLTALDSQADVLFERRVAALALTLGVRDAVQIENVFPRPDEALALAKEAVKRHLSVFGLPPFAGAREIMGTTASVQPTEHVCRVELTALEQIDGEPDYVRVMGRLDGWPSSKTASLRLLDADRRVIGIALEVPASALPGGEPGRADLAFKGYLHHPTGEDGIQMLDPESGCDATVALLNPASPILDR